jgi:7-cyano-7-deazaguanine synthase
LIRTVFLSFSGGADSTTLLAHLLRDAYNVRPVFFDYGSKHGPFEYSAARAVCDHYGIPLEMISLRDVLDGGDSALMAGNDREIPSGPGGYHETGSLAATVVPGRNLLMASILAGRAEAHGLRTAESAYIGMGIHGGDHALYPDCRPEFLESLRQVLRVGTEGRVGLVAPFGGLSKGEIIIRGKELQVPYALTRSCYDAREFACGVCSTCRERLEAFAFAGLSDPIPYKTMEAPSALRS